LKKLLSIIIPTLGRVEQVAALLRSIVDTSGDSILEVVVVDQNQDDRLVRLLSEYSSVLPLRHERVGFKGVSKARNYGVRQAAGKYVVFADDDCEFIPGSIATGLGWLEDHPNFSAICGRAVDRNRKDTMAKWGLSRELDLNHIYNHCVEFAIIFRRDVFGAYTFDEQLGPGCVFGAEEGYDLVYRLIRGGERLYYSRDIVFYHPQKIENHMTPQECDRVLFYRRGFAHMCKKNGLWKMYIQRVVLVCGYLGFLMLTLNPKRKYYIRELQGLISGLFMGAS